MLKIANLTIEPALILAPMAGITDLAYRRLMRRFGCPLAFIEMINVRALSHNKNSTADFFLSDDTDRPLGIQILGREEKFILNALEEIHKHPIDILDFNAACPVRKVVRRGEGAALLKEPKRLAKLLRLIRKNTHLPLTLKIRTGWNKDCINAIEIASLGCDSGIDCLFIHGRTREQNYSNDIDYKTISKVKKSISIPVVASGNLLSAILAKKMLEETKVDGLSLARGTLGNPWLFKEIETFLEKGVILARPQLEEIVTVIFEHLDEMINSYGERIALKLFRKFIGWYFKGQRNVREIRELSNKIKTKQELLDLLSTNFLKKTEVTNE
ncbi:MAG: tRNA-dihydrouridine synthase [Candidatus Omnitrophota bacterium]